MLVGRETSTNSTTKDKDCFMGAEESRRNEMLLANVRKASVTQHTQGYFTTVKR